MVVTEVITGLILILLGVYVWITSNKKAEDKEVDFTSEKWRRIRSKNLAVLLVFMGSFNLFGAADFDFFSWIVN